MSLANARAGMNPEIRPQDDLFGHVNGRWLDTVEIPADKSSWGPFAQLAEIAEEQVHAIVAELAAGTPADDDGRKIAALYASFMDEATAAERGLDPVAPQLRAVGELRDIRQLAVILGEYERTGVSGLFGVYVDTDDRNSDRYLVKIGQGGLGLPDETYYRDDKFAEVRAKYVEYLTELLTLAGYSEPAAA